MRMVLNKLSYYYNRHGACYSIFRKVAKEFRKSTAILDGCKILTNEYYRYFKGLDRQGVYKELQLQLSVFYNDLEISYDLTTPHTFEEKIQWLKIFGDVDKMAMLADKVSVRDWISDQIGVEYLIPIVGGPWNSFGEIDFSDLPDNYVIKANHGSGMNLIVKNNNIDKKRSKRIIDSWTRTVFGCNGVEQHYFKIKPIIYAEKYIEEKGNLYDYKIHCFNGEPKFIQVIGNRDLKKHTAKQKNYDFEWKDIGWVFEDYPAYDSEIARPQSLDKMYEVAKKLSSDFPYVRVDLYEVNGKVYFGEMTFTPAGGFYPYKGTWNREMDEKLGSWIHL